MMLPYFAPGPLGSSSLSPSSPQAPQNLRGTRFLGQDR